MVSKPVPLNPGEDASNVVVGVSRWRPALAHLLMSSLVLAVAAIGVFFIWYPPPYISLSGGLKLFGLLAVVDMLLGPLGTLVVSNPKKPKAEWRRDVSIIVLVQAAALFYGMWTVYQARPVYLVFEIDRFRAIHAVDVPVELLPAAPTHLQRLPISGPGLIAVRPFRNQNESTEVTLAALQGLAIGARPDMWMDYSAALPQVMAAAKPLSALLKMIPESREPVQKALRETEIQTQDVVYLPLVSRMHFSVVLLDIKTGLPLAYIAVDPLPS